MSAKNAENYLSFFGFEQDPFGSGNAVPFYQTNKLAEHIDLISHLTRFSNVILTLIGGEGIGKTSLSGILRDKLNPTLYTSQIYAESNLSCLKFLKLLCDEFDIASHCLKEEPLLEQLKSLHQCFAETDQQHVVLIDDAHQLSDDILELLLMLSRLQEDDGVYCHFILLGETGLMLRLDRRANEHSAAPLVYQLNLKPLDYDELSLFLDCYLTYAGYSGEDPFSENDLAKIYQLSSGYPAPVLRLARSQLIAKAQSAQEEEEAQLEKPSSRVRVLGGAVLSVALLSAIYLIAFESSDFFRKRAAGNQELLVSTESIDLAQSRDFLPFDEQSVDRDPFEYTVGFSVFEGLESLSLDEANRHRERVVEASIPEPTWYLYQERDEIDAPLRVVPEYLMT